MWARYCKECTHIKAGWQYKQKSDALRQVQQWSTVKMGRLSTGYKNRKENGTLYALQFKCLLNTGGVLQKMTAKMAQEIKLGFLSTTYMSIEWCR